MLILVPSWLTQPLCVWNIFAMVSLSLHKFKRMSNIFLPFLQPVKGQSVTLLVFFSPVCPAVLLLSAWDVEYYAGDYDKDCDNDEDGDDSEEVDDDDRRITEGL